VNLRVVDEWRPGNEQHQHSESDMGKDSTKIRIETYLHSISTNILSADDFVSRRGHLLYHKFCQSKNHRRPCIRIRVGRVAFRWQIRWTSANNLHLIMPPSPSFYGTLGKFMSRPCQVVVNHKTELCYEWNELESTRSILQITSASDPEDRPLLSPGKTSSSCWPSLFISLINDKTH
jgi:hypothetical protein